MSTPSISQSSTLPESPTFLARFAALLRAVLARSEFGPFVLLVVEMAIFISQSDTFLSTGNISNFLIFTPELGMIALGMTLLMTAGEFDLSVGSVFGCAPIVMWTLFNQDKTSLEAGFAIALGLAALVGLVNGLFVTLLRIPSFLVTLGMLLIVRGSALYITDGFPQRTWRAESALKDWIVGEFTIKHFGISIPIPFTDEHLINFSVDNLRLYYSLVWFILFAVILHYILTTSKFGNWIQASGGNPISARARGVRVGYTKIMMFILTAVLSAYAGITSSIRVSAANPNSGEGYELEVIAMVVIGGTILTGGRGTIIGTVLGVLILRVMRNGIVMIGVPGLAYNIFIGTIILGMMSLHSWLERRHNVR